MGERKNYQWNEECYLLNRETREALRRWKNQKITREEFLKVRETYRSKRKDRKNQVTKEGPKRKDIKRNRQVH